MSGECENCGEHCTECRCCHRYRYTCPECLRTFIDKRYSEEFCCDECGEELDVSPKKGNIYGSPTRVDIEISEVIMSLMAPIYKDFKEYPYELIDAFTWLIEVVTKELLKDEEIR